MSACIHTNIVESLDCDLLEGKCLLYATCQTQALYYTCTPHLSPCFLYNPYIPLLIFIHLYNVLLEMMMSVLQDVEGLTKNYTSLYFPGGIPVSIHNFTFNVYTVYLF